jgi:transcriptional regulator with XRE-family HTH domain|nr:helix-turn-helix transcriptional regulator [uncultured Limnohabitans sp.]
MSLEEVFINGELLRLRRESRGWALNDIAIRACMSVKQIRQIEEGGLSSFYSIAVKVTAAKKVGVLLGLTSNEVLTQNIAPESIDLFVPTDSPVDEVYAGATDLVPAVSQELPLTEVESFLPDEAASETTVIEQSKSQTFLWVIGGLFLTALSVAAYMQPQEEPTAESPPPLQVLPPDLANPASSSAASSADIAASIADVVVPSVAKPSSSSASKAP